MHPYLFAHMLFVGFAMQADRSLGQKIASHLNMRPSI